jgi:hypothetical protein
MRWMVDFTDAEQHGMALRLKVPAAVAQQGIDALVVFGVSSLDPAVASTAIASLLDAHHYTDGLGFLRVGTTDQQQRRGAVRRGRRRIRCMRAASA